MKWTEIVTVCRECNRVDPEIGDGGYTTCCDKLTEEIAGAELARRVHENLL